MNATEITKLISSKAEKYKKIIFSNKLLNYINGARQFLDKALKLGKKLAISIPNLTNVPQERYFEIDGDKLALSTFATLINGEGQSFRLVWERVE